MQPRHNDPAKKIYFYAGCSSFLFRSYTAPPRTSVQSLSRFWGYTDAAAPVHASTEGLLELPRPLDRPFGSADFAIVISFVRFVERRPRVVLISPLRRLAPPVLCFLYPAPRNPASSACTDRSKRLESKLSRNDDNPLSRVGQTGQYTTVSKSIRCTRTTS